MTSAVSSNKKITYRKHGSGEPIILLHGFAGSVLHWNEIVQELSQRFRVYVVNFSHFYLANPLKFSEQVKVLAQFIKDEFHHEKVTLAGISYGAALTWGVSTLIPDQIQKIIYINPMSSTSTKNFQMPAIKYFFKVPMTRELVFQILRTPLGKGFLKNLAAVFRSEKRAEGEISVEQLKGRKLFFVTALISNFGWILRQENWKDWDEKLKNYNIPSLMIYDSRDPLFKKEGYIQFAKQMKCVEVLELAGAGHICLQNSSVQISRAVESFLNYRSILQAQGF